MYDAVERYLSVLLEHLRWADVVDVALAAFFIYLVLQWIRRTSRQTGTRSVLITLAGLAALFAAAQRFEMVLVETLSQVLLVVLALGAIVVFQTDIRRAVDRLGALVWLRRPRVDRAPAPPVEVLTEACSRLASMRHGALIALRGRQPWGRYVEGGMALDGQVSQPLLLSLLHPAAPTHDGAVLLDGDRVVLFGAHLPLSTGSQVGGTRHAAGLGLSEQCDALVIVVSEERGTISVAERGVLDVMDSAGALQRRLTRFWADRYAPEEGPARREWRRVSLPAALLSTVLAAALWILLAFRPDTVQRTFAVPIELRNLSPQWALEEPPPTEARVTLTGSEQAFRLLDPSRLAVSLNVSELEPGANEFVVTERSLQLPHGLELYDVEPGVVALRVQARPNAPAEENEP